MKNVLNCNEQQFMWKMMCRPASAEQQSISVRNIRSCHLPFVAASQHLTTSHEFQKTGLELRHSEFS